MTEARAGAARQRPGADSWRSPRRGLAYGFAGCWAAQAAVYAIQPGRRLLALAYAVVAVACLAWALRIRRVQVSTDLQNLRVCERESVVLPWTQVREVRGDAGRWSTRTVVETRDGQVVLLPEGLDVARVRQWQHEALMAREYPEQVQRRSPTSPSCS